VCEQSQRQLRVVTTDPFDQQRDVVDPTRPSIRTPAAVVAARGAARTAGVWRVHEVARIGQRLGEATVAPRVLGEAVLDLHDGLRAAVGRPAVGLDLDAVTAGEHGGRLVHGLDSGGGASAPQDLQRRPDGRSVHSWTRHFRSQ
jgi:hypothetical protein